MLTRQEIRKLIELTKLETVVNESRAFPFRVVRLGSGYADDPEIARIQGKLSMMLEAAANRGGV